MTTTTPVIENVKVHAASIKLYVDMNLAGVPVTVIGSYNIDSNCFYPSTIFPTIKIVVGTDTIAESTAYSVEAFTELMGWDYGTTHDAIQTAVEERDR